MEKEFSNILTKVTSLKEVAVLLDIPPKKLSYLLYRLLPEQRYLTFSIRKKNGSFRDIKSPNPALRNVQKKLNSILQDFFQEVYGEKRSKYIFGFLKGQSIKDNAMLHVHRRFIVNIDLKDFFSQITFPRIRGMFLKYPFNLPPKAATVLAQIVTCDSVLPQGAPTSPIISNFICAKMDGDLWRFACKHKLKYSRYADDLTFSTHAKQLPDALGEISLDNTFILSEKLKQIIEKRNHFFINGKKTRCMKRDVRQEVTGLTVNDKVNVPHKYIKQIRAMLHDWQTNGEERALQKHMSFRKKYNKPGHLPQSFSSILFGKILYIKQICGEDSFLYRKFLFQYQKIASAESPLIASSKKQDLALGIFIVEDEISISQGTAFYLPNIGLITNAHVLSSDRICMNNAYADIEPQLFVYRHEGTKYRVKIIHVDQQHDFAILSIYSEQPIAGFYYSEDISESQDIVIAGYPNYSNEELSCIKAHITGKKNYAGCQYYSVDHGIVTGNSGGPVFNTNYEVIGIATRGGETTEEAEKTWCAFIPIHYVIQCQE